MPNAPQQPRWAFDILRDPESGDRLELSGSDVVTATDGAPVGVCIEGVLRLPIRTPDRNIDFYRRIGGARFHERAAIPFAMSSLDTSVYHSHLREVGLAGDALVIDVGGGDGRNAWSLLRESRCRIVMVDAVAEALLRFRQRLSQAYPDDLDRVLLVEADARRLPLADACADLAVAIEVLYYLDADYEIGVRECARVLKPRAGLLLSERDYEGGLLMRLLYDGVEGMLQTAREHALWDGRGDERTRTRCFTQAELHDILTCAGFEIDRNHATSILSLVLGWLNGQGRLAEADSARLDEIQDLLEALSRTGVLRRCHVISAKRAA